MMMTIFANLAGNGGGNSASDVLHPRRLWPGLEEMLWRVVERPSVALAGDSEKWKVGFECHKTKIDCLEFGSCSAFLATTQ